MSASTTPTLDEVVRCVYQTCYFILSDKKESLSVVLQALAKLKITAAAQQKREAKKPRRGVQQKVSLGELQMLQYLAYVTSEHYERLQEYEHLSGAQPLTQGDMIIRYIKHLMLIYLERNSFFATVGQGCVLFALKTSQVIRLYETLVQCSPKHLETKGDYSVRDAKRDIRRRLGERFAEFLTVYDGPRGEKCFVSMNDSSDYFGLTKRALHRLKPLVYAEGRLEGCPLPVEFAPVDYDIDALQSPHEPANVDEERLVELRRMHVVTHTCCFARLVRALGFCYTRRQLALPSFNLGRNGTESTMPRNDRNTAPELTSIELSAIVKTLEKQAVRRRKLSPSHLLVKVDGACRQDWDLFAEEFSRIEIGNAKVVEVIALHKNNEIPLAVCLPRLARAAPDQTASSIVLEGRQEFTFSILERGGGEGNSCEVIIGYRENRAIRAFVLALRRRFKFARTPRFDDLLSPAGVLTGLSACLMLLITFGFFAFKDLSGRSEESRTFTTGEIGEVAIAGDDDNKTRSNDYKGQLAEPDPALSLQSESGKQQGGKGGRLNKRRQAGGWSVVGRAGPIQGEPEAVTRALRQTNKGVDVSQLNRIRVDLIEAGQLADAIRQGLEAGIARSGLTVVEEQAKADAVVTGEITPAVTGRRRLELRIRLVDRGGRVLWSSRFLMGAADNLSSANEAASRAVAGLAGYIKGQRQGRREKENR